MKQDLMNSLKYLGFVKKFDMNAIGILSGISLRSLAIPRKGKYLS